MARTYRLEVRVEPALAQAIKYASGDLTSLSRWLEVAAREKLARDGIPVVKSKPNGTSEPVEPEPEHDYGSRAPPRMQGGRKQH